VCVRARWGEEISLPPYFTGSSFVRATSRCIRSYLAEARRGMGGEWGKLKAIDTGLITYCTGKCVYAKSFADSIIQQTRATSERTCSSTRDPNRRCARSNPRNKNGGAPSHQLVRDRELDAQKSRRDPTYTRTQIGKHVKRGPTNEARSKK